MFSILFSYTLLGPSGCGKTTLFKCIVGMQSLDSGEIFVKSNEKCKIGYMPQASFKHFNALQVFHKTTISN